MASISDDQKIKMYLAKNKDAASFIENLEDLLTDPKKERYGLTAYGRDLFSKVFGGDSKISRLLRNKYSDVWKGTIQRFRLETPTWTKGGRPSNAVRTVTRGSSQDKSYAYINRSIEPETGHRESASDASILLSDDFVPYGEILSHKQKEDAKALSNVSKGLGSWTSKRSKILSTMGDTVGEAFYEKVANLERSKHHWSSRISLGKISREFNVRSAIGSGMHGVHGTLGGIPGFRIHTERDAEDYLWFLNHKGEMTERGAYNAVRMNRSLDAQKLRRKHSKSFRDRIKAGDEAYEADIADATGDDAWRQEKLIRSLAKTYNPNDLKKGQERARNVLFARNHKVLYKISQWLPKTATPLNKLAVPFQKFGMHLSGLTSIGKGLGLGAMSNPFTMGIALGWGALKAEEKFSRETDEANKKVNDWQNKLSVHGAPSKEFQAAARLAGIDDYGQIVKLHAEMQQKYGDADLGLRAIGMATGKLTRKQRSFFASSEGLSDEAMVIADILARNGRTSITEARLTEARVSANEFRQIVNRRSGSGFWSTASSILQNPSSDARYHDANGNFIFRGEGDIFEQMKNAQESAYRAASSADEYDAGKLSSTEISTSIGTITNNFYGVENSEDIVDKITASTMSASQRALSKTSSSKIG